jgi:3-hydroxybutyryl-CoA dehydrogenase
MAENSVAIIGASRLGQELAALCRQKGFAVGLVNETSAISPSTPLVIETSALDSARKRSILQQLDTSLAPASVLLTSCLGAAVTDLAAPLNRPERIFGFATFYPINERKLIELAAGLRSAENTAQSVEQFFNQLDISTVRVKDAAGLIFPRVLSLIINEAARALDEGVASAEEIDLAMRLGVNYPQGPLKWADQIGLDDVLAVLDGLHRETGDDRYRAVPLLRKLVAAGFLGEVTARGFYCYTQEQVKP